MSKKEAHTRTRYRGRRTRGVGSANVAIPLDSHIVAVVAAPVSSAAHAYNKNRANPFFGAVVGLSTLGGY
eukprot:scaffold2718_cov103-Isochrysis_galbana.AAC.5